MQIGEYVRVNATNQFGEPHPHAGKTGTICGIVNATQTSSIITIKSGDELFSASSQCMESI